MKTAKDIDIAIDEAGHTMRRMSGSGCWPSGYKSNWPDTLRELGLIEMVDLKTEVRKSPPTSRAISELDRLLVLIASANLSPDDRRLLWMRAGCVPGKRRSWKAIGRAFACDRTTAWRKYVVILDYLARTQRKTAQRNSAHVSSGIAA